MVTQHKPNALPEWAQLGTASGAPASGPAPLFEPKPETPGRIPTLRHLISPLAAVSSNAMPKPAKFACLVIIGCIGFVGTMHAHDPGLSSLTVKLNGSHLEAVATFARKDIEGLLESPVGQATEPCAERRRLQELANGVLAVEKAGRQLEPVDARARFDDQGNVEFRLNFVADAS